MENDIIKKIIQTGANESWWKNSHKEVVEKYGSLFNPANIDSLTKEDFKSFLLIKNNLHWEGIHRQGNIITSDMDVLKKFLQYLLDENIPIRERLKRTLDKNGDLVIKGLGRAVGTPILLVVYPNKYGVWNSRCEDALKKLNLLPEFLPKDTFADRYLKVNNVLLDLADQYNINLWQLDGVLGQISGNGPFAKVPDEEEAIEKEAKEYGIFDVGNFAMESQLEDFLITNWNKTTFGNKYELIYEEGDLLSKQYPTDVGPIDILAKSKDGKEYLVIELKKGRTSDAVVGQILRYIGWVREHLAEGKTIKGAIVVLDTDNKLKYAVKELTNITLYTYQVSFKLNKEELRTTDTVDEGR